MRKLVIHSLAVFATISILMPGPASAQEKTKTIVIDENKVKIEEKGAFLGIYMEDLDKDMVKEFGYPKTTGVLISEVIDGSPAEEAGLEENDIIYTLAGKKVKNSKELAELVASREPGDEVKLVVYRDGKKKSYSVELGEKKTAYVTIDEYPDMANKAYIKTLGKGGNMWVSGPGDVFSFYGNRGRIGVQLHELDEDLAPYFDVKEGEGVLVLKVFEDSPAEEAGFKAGDIIVKVGDEDIEDVEDVLNALHGIHMKLEDDDDSGEAMDAAEKVDVTVLRMGKQKTLEVELDDDYALEREYIIRAPQMEGMKQMQMMHQPQIKEFKLQGMEQEKLEAKIKALEKEMEKLQKKLEKMDKTD